MSDGNVIALSSTRVGIRILNAFPFGLGGYATRLLIGDGMKARVLRGSAWTIIGFGVGQVLRLASNVVLAWLLFPEAFGLMALVNVFLLGLQMLSDIGIGLSIVQHERGDDEDFLCTAWTMQVIRGFLLFLGACFIAWPSGWFYGEPQLAYMIGVSGLTVLVGGFQTTAIPQHSRHLRVGRIALIGLLGQVISLTATILLAWQMRSVWALVWGSVVGAAMGVVVGHACLPGIKHRFLLDRTYAREMMHFGKWLFVATAAAYLASNIDRLILGALVDPGTLGIYGIAMTLAMLPFSIMQALSGNVVLPALARVANDRAEFRRKFNRFRTAAFTLLSVISISMSLAIPYIIRTLYDDRYWSMIPLVQICLLTTVFGTNVVINNSALLAVGCSRGSGYKSLFSLACLPPAMVIGYHFGGVAGLVCGVAVGNLIVTLFLHIFLMQEEIYVFVSDAKWLFSLTVALILSSMCQ